MIRDRLKSYGGGLLLLLGLSAQPAFAGIQPSDAMSPSGPLVEAADGNLYGLTRYGGSKNFGTIYRVTPSGQVTILYSFQGGAKGAEPARALLLAKAGGFYGVTVAGGQSNTGTIFKFNPPDKLTVLASFGPDDVSPLGIIQGRDGALYGTTGNPMVRGRAFKLAADNKLTVLFKFGSESGMGGVPSSLIEGADGNFYVTTQEGGIQEFPGGPSDRGFAVRVSASGKASKVASFNQSNDFWMPNGLMQDADGSFYGTTLWGGKNGGGAAFRIDSQGKLSLLASFPAGATPTAALIAGRDGNFYGIGSGDSKAATTGGVYKLSRKGELSMLARFDNANGAHPVNGITQARDGNFYGTTVRDGAYGGGTLFRMAPDGKVTTLLSFKRSAINY